jgi:N-ethylmaleimide reductase
MAPMTRNRAGPGNVPGALAVEYYTQRATVGLIVTEATQVSPQGVGYHGTPGIHSDAQVVGWRRVTDAAHQAGGRIFLQLWHVGRISHPSLQPDGALRRRLPPRARPSRLPGRSPSSCRARSTAEIPDLVAQFEAGARHARAAGFDGVEIHGANGYLVDQFLRDGTNRRTDRYGGSLANRARFLIEVTEAVAGAWGAARVGVRLSPRADFNSMSDSDPRATFGHAALALSTLGLAYLHIVEPVGALPEGTAALAPDLKEAFGGPLMLNGGYTRLLAEAALARGEADLVSFGASFLANPDLPLRLAHDAPLNTPDHATFYGGDERGYTDYPTLAGSLVAA